MFGNGGWLFGCVPGVSFGLVRTLIMTFDRKEKHSTITRRQNAKTKNQSHGTGFIPKRKLQCENDFGRQAAVSRIIPALRSRAFPFLPERAVQNSAPRIVRTTSARIMPVNRCHEIRFTPFCVCANTANHFAT
jgi:hypothetical protein